MRYYPYKTVCRTNIDSGKRWLVYNAAKLPIYSWDSRNHRTRTEYDALLRPLSIYLQKGMANEQKVQQNEYGTSAAKNNIGQIEHIYAQDGKTTYALYDFKGNPLQVVKQFCEDYQNTIDWNAAPTLKNETFAQQFAYDAMNRPLSQSMPDGTVITNTYNKAGLLETVKKDSETFVSNINYNEKGQRTAIFYGNNTKTKYEYDPLTFRLTRLLTTRNNGVDILQDLNYTYDPVGNIIQIIDNAQQTHYFNNSVISPVSIYKYDALYRLVEAKGRELKGLQMSTHNDFVNNIPIPNNAANAMQNYTQQFQYDELGNIMQMKSVGNWTRDYFYNESNNYLLGHTANTTEYTYDQHGNMLSIPHLNSMLWDYKDELKEVVLNANNDKAYYVYDSTGERVRKIIEKGNIVEERYYLGDYELYRKTTNNTVNVERTTVHVSDDQKRIAMVDNNGTNETIRYQYDNHLGSASLELDHNANIISYEEYHPFGTTSYRSGKIETEISLKRYKYVGKERDEETGLYYYGARYYAGWLGRWTAVDPRATKYPWYSPFIAMNNNPIYFTDPTGKSGVAYKTNKKNKATGRPILRIKANIYIYGKGANETRKEAIQSEIQTQYNRNEDYFTYTDDGGTIYDVIFEFKTEILENSSVNSKISELKPENNFYEIDEGEDSFTLAGIYGGNTGIFTINDLDQSKGTVSHELNHGFGGEGHPKSPIPLDREIDITLPQDQKNTSGNYIDATKRKVTQKNITNILSKVKFNYRGEGTVGFPRPHKANRTKLRYEDVRE